MRVADTDNDGHLDLVFTAYGGFGVGILFRYGNGSFQSHVIYPTINNLQTFLLALGHLNEDSYLDIVVVTQNPWNRISFSNTNNRTFSTAKSQFLGNGTGPAAINLADLNMDRQSDTIIRFVSTETMYVLLNQC